MVQGEMMSYVRRLYFLIMIYLKDNVPLSLNSESVISRIQYIEEKNMVGV